MSKKTKRLFLPLMIKQHSNNAGTIAFIVSLIQRTCPHEALLDRRTKFKVQANYFSTPVEEDCRGLIKNTKIKTT